MSEIIVFKEGRKRVKKKIEMSGNKKQNLNAVFIGPPGAGKGTQATNLKKDYSVCHLSTGDMLRAAVSSGSPLGKQVDGIMKRGELVADEIMVNIIKEAIKAPECREGFILDGFPRTVKQAEKVCIFVSSLLFSWIPCLKRIKRS